MEFVNIEHRPDGFYMKQDQYRSSEEIGQPSYSKYRITAIKVSVKEGANWVIYRQYDLDNDQAIMMNKDIGDTDADERDYGHMLLKSITPKGRNGASGLPAYTFEYNTDNRSDLLNYEWNHTRLTKAHNGYGGRVEFNYTTSNMSCTGMDGTLNRYVVEDIKTYAKPGGPLVSETEFSYASPECRIDWRDVAGNNNQKKKARELTGRAWFLGFGDVTTTHKDGAGSTINTTQYYTAKWVSGAGQLPHVAAGTPKNVSTSGTGFSQSATMTWVEQPGDIWIFNQLGWNDIKLGWAKKTSESATIDGNTATTSYSYDASPNTNYGYPTQILAQGSASTTQDDQKKSISYIHKPGASPRFLGIPKQETVRGYGDPDGDGTLNDNVILRDTKLYYDNQAWGVLGSAANLTTLEAFNSNGSSIQSHFQYDGWGNQTRVTDANSHFIRNTYDSAHHVYVVSTKNQLNHETTFVPDYGRGVIKTVTDANGNSINNTYDDFGRLTEVFLPGDGVDSSQKYSYSTPDGSGLYRVSVEQRVDDATEATAYLTGHYFYNGLGQLIQTHSPSDTPGQIIAVDTEYNAQGLAARTNQPYESADNGGSGLVAPNWLFDTNYDYDGLGRLNTTTFPDGTDTSVSYSGWNQTITDANNHNRLLKLDAFGRLVEAVEYDNGTPFTTQYKYNALGELASVTDAAGNVTTITYDMLGRKTEMDDPDMGNWRYRYDAVGNLTAQIDAKRQATNLYYDILNRAVGKTYAAGVNPDTYQRPATPGTYVVKYLYDQSNGLGHTQSGYRTQMLDEAGIVTWVYDERGRVQSMSRLFTSPYDIFDNSLSAISGDAYQTSYTYDAANRIRTITYPDDEELITGYTNRGLLNSLSNTAGDDYVTSAVYDVQARLNVLNLGNNLQTKYTYYPANDPGQQGNRLENIKITDFGTLLDLNYDQYDPMGNIKQITDNSAEQNLTFGYDDLDRLTSASAVKFLGSSTTVPNYNHSYEYDSVGNIDQKTIDGLLMNYSYDPNHPHAVTSVFKAAILDAYLYDDNGNMTRRTESVGGNPAITYIQD